MTRLHKEIRGNRTVGRRIFLAGAGAAGAAGAAALAAPAVAQGAIEWNMVMPWPRNAPGVGVNAERLANRINAMSGGRLRVKLFAAGELVPPFESFDAVRGGTADALHATPYYWVGKSKAFNYFTTLPYGLTATEMGAWLAFGGGQALWDELYAGFGLKPFYAGSSGVQAGGWFNREIKALGDLAGLKMRIAGIGGEVLRRAGVTVVNLPPGEILAAMRSGAVDAAEWVGPWNDLAMGLPKVAKYYYVPAFHEPGPALELAVSKARFDALPADLQAIVAAAAAASAQETLADFTYHNTVSLAPLLSEHGVQLRSFSDEIATELGKITRTVVEELAATDALTGRIHASYIGFLRQAVGYSDRFEAAMLRQRRAAAL
jgi:TRAP-type mannitol/chloroaromatic compound transport system substrate-binding protein